MHFDRQIYFDAVRPLFGGQMTQGQVDGQEAILSGWERRPPSDDLRHLAYCLATTKHETASEMQPIEEYGRGKGMPYGVEEPPGSGNVFYGRGYVQLTWADNYVRATSELGLSGEDDLYAHPDQALDRAIAADVMFRGMMEGWFRAPNSLPAFFGGETDDPYGAREIINGDKAAVPSWTGGVSIGELVAAYHVEFHSALLRAVQPKRQRPLVRIDVTLPVGADLIVTVNGMVAASIR